MAGVGTWRGSSWQDGRLSLPVLGQPSYSGLHSQKSSLLCSPRAQEAKKGRWLQQDHFKTGHTLEGVLETFLERTGSLEEGLSSMFWHVGGSGRFASLVGYSKQRLHLGAGETRWPGLSGWESTRVAQGSTLCFFLRFHLTPCLPKMFKFGVP